MKKLFLFLAIAVSLCLITGFLYLSAEPFLCPIKYKSDIVIRCDGRGNGFFAAERNGRRLHEGIDLYAPVGTPVLAARSAKVIAARYTRGMGNYIILRHLGNIITVYGHLSRIYVAKGQFVPRGEVIGAVGKTGNANYRNIQPHLHFEVRKKGVPQDPLAYLQ